MTVASYNKMFCNEYALNQKDTSAGLPGILYGRYQVRETGMHNNWSQQITNVFP
jgi:hypothetical protein